MEKGFLKNILIIVAFIIATVVLFRTNALYGFLFLLAVILLFLFLKRGAILALIGRTYYYKSNMEKSLTWFERAYKTGVAKPQTVASYAYLLLKSGKIQEAENILEILLRLNLSEDNRMMAKSNMALVQWKKGYLDEAIATLEEVIKVYETSNIYGSLGYMLIQRGNLDKALEFNLKAYDYNSENAIILDNLGQVYYLKQDYDKAHELYEKLMAKEPSFPEAYYNYALLLKAKGEYEKALEKAEKALNYKLSFLSTIQKDDIDILINELKNHMEKSHS
jgi:tetratricopeptide (TPR) repeat protein